MEELHEMTRSEIMQVFEYWGEEYTKHPEDFDDDNGNYYDDADYFLEILNKIKGA